MLFSFLLVPFLIISSIIFPVHAEALKVQEVILENGLKILLLENRKSPVVTFQVWYRVGARNDEDSKTGLAHFLEHMVGPKDYSRIIAKNGGRSNAFTTADTTVYFANMSREKVGVAIELEAERMAANRLDGAEFETEKNVVMEERRLGIEDNPVSALSEVASAVAYTMHPYRRPIIGWMKDIENISQEELERHFRTYYVPNNAFIVAVGDFSAPEMLAKIKAHFGGIPRGPEPPKMGTQEPAQRGERRVILKKEAELPVLLLHYHSPNARDPDSFALDLLSVILAQGRSSRLYQELVYRMRLVRGVSADYYGLSVDPTIFSITAQLMPGKDPREVERALDELLDRVRSEPVSDAELEKAKKQVEAAFVFGQDSVFGQAMRIGYYEVSVGWRLLDGYLDGIRKVTAKDILRVARRYLHPDSRTIATLIPAEPHRTK